MYRSIAFVNLHSVTAYRQLPMTQSNKKLDAGRVAALRVLVEKAGGPAQFAKEYSRPDADKPIDPSYISQILNGHRSFGEKAAENMEKRAGLSPGYFSSFSENNNIELGPDIKGRVPLISHVQAGEWSEIIDNFASGDAEQWLPCPVCHSKKTFALRVRGESMYNPHSHPSFRDGDLIYVDPEKQPINGSLVVARLENEKEATFKKLIIDGAKKYLRALNPAWPEPIIQINSDATICGVVIFKGEIL